MFSYKKIIKNNGKVHVTYVLVPVSSPTLHRIFITWEEWPPYSKNSLCADDTAWGPDFNDEPTQGYLKKNIVN